jgi:hypothetical protein
LLGAEYTGNSFTCEPVNNLVHRQVLSRQSATFTSRRADDELNREFLASTDPWFRPVQARTGPDGGLWVVDMYRFVIEHPIWIPPETLATLDTRAGASLGRIYRVVPAESILRKTPRLDQLTTEELASLDTPNVREEISSIRCCSGGMMSVSGSRKLRAKFATGSPSGAAVCLGRLELPSDEALLQAMADSHPGIRRHAVRIAESQLNNSLKISAAVIHWLATMIRRSDCGVFVGAWSGTTAAGPLVKPLLSDP